MTLSLQEPQESPAGAVYQLHARIVRALDALIDGQTELAVGILEDLDLELEQAAIAA